LTKNAFLPEFRLTPKYPEIINYDYILTNLGTDTLYAITSTLTNSDYTHKLYKFKADQWKTKYDIVKFPATTDGGAERDFITLSLKTKLQDIKAGGKGVYAIFQVFGTTTTIFIIFIYSETVIICGLTGQSPSSSGPKNISDSTLFFIKVSKFYYGIFMKFNFQSNFQSSIAAVFKKGTYRNFQ